MSDMATPGPKVDAEETSIRVIAGVTVTQTIIRLSDIPDISVSYSAGAIGLGEGFDALLDETKLRELLIENDVIETVTCKFCVKECIAATAHLHQGQWVGDECCWDERLRSSE
jgi:hypothetical protein